MLMYQRGFWQGERFERLRLDLTLLYIQVQEKRKPERRRSI